MSEVNQEMLYTESHEWVRDNGDGTWSLGISDNAQELLGDMVFVELPEVGATFSTKSDMCVVESVKAATDVYAPCDLEVTAINENLEATPELINSDCYGDGYLLTFTANNVTGLMNAKEYEDFLGA